MRRMHWTASRRVEFRHTDLEEGLRRLALGVFEPPDSVRLGAVSLDKHGQTQK
jgi:hypothetical protein